MPITGAFSGETLTVDAMVKDPTYIKERILEDLDKSFLEEALFRNAGANDGIVAYAEAVAPFLNDEAEAVAEYAEIPISNLDHGKVKSLIGHKTALGVSVSLEQRRFNRIDPVAQQVNALKNTMVRSSVRASLAAFNAAEVQTLKVSNKWDSKDANPLGDIRAAKRLISQAKPKNNDKALFGYKPDTLVIAESTLEAALEHENTQKFFVGNMANENPIFKGILPSGLAQLRIVTSSWLEEDEIYVMEAQTAGFYSDSIPLTVSDLYSPYGENGYGGTTQSWRVDAFRTRIIAVDNPKAVVKIQGALGDEE